MDKFTKEQRHKCMSRIRGKDTLPELLVRKRLFSHGWRYRVCDRRFPGRPDIVIPKARTIVDVRGCFWHRHGCKDSTMPKSNVQFWMEKWSKNVKRDIRNEEAWREAGWNMNRCLAMRAGWREGRKDAGAHLRQGRGMGGRTQGRQGAQDSAPA